MSAQARGRAGKYHKAKRGGGRQFSKGLRPLEKDGAERSMWAEPVSDDDDDSSEEDSEEESSDDEAPAVQASGEMTREERRAAAKAKKEAAIKKKKGTPAVGDMPSSSEEESEDDDMPANPNHTASARKMAAKPVEPPSDAPKDAKPKKVEDVSQLSRREREAFQKQQAKERYDKLHAEGKTEEARADMERLALVRQQRADAAARKEAEKAEKDEMEREKKEQMERMDRQAKMKAARGGKGAKKGGKA